MNDLDLNSIFRFELIDLSELESGEMGMNYSNSGSSGCGGDFGYCGKNCGCSGDRGNCG